MNVYSLYFVNRVTNVHTFETPKHNKFIVNEMKNRKGKGEG